MSEVWFGNTPGSTATIAANFVYFFPATCTQDGSVTSMRCKSGSATGFSIKLAVYADSSGTPGSKLGETGAISINATATIFTAAVTASFSVTNGTPYHLAWLKSGGNSNIAFANSGSDRFLAATYPTFPSSGSGSTGGTGTGYIEAGVTPAGGSTFVPLIASMFKAAETWGKRTRGILVPDLWVPSERGVASVT